MNPRNKKIVLEYKILKYKLLYIYLLLLILGLYLILPINCIYDEKDANFQNKLDLFNKDIIKYRTGRLLIKTEPNQIVEIEQIKHEFIFGSAISSEIFSDYNKMYREMYFKIFQDNFNYAVHENALKWTTNEDEQGKHNFKIADEITKYCLINQIPIRGHCLFWSISEKNPTWVSKLDQDELSIVIKNRITEVINRYRQTIIEYDVINEMTHGDFFIRKYNDNGIISNIYKWTYQVDSSLHLYVNDYNILTGEKTTDYIQQINSLLLNGAPIHGIGCQGHFIKNYFSESEINQVLGRLAKFNLPIKITEFDIDTKNEKQKAKSLEMLFHIFFANPAVEGIILWGFWEGAHWHPNAALWKINFEITPAGLVYRNIVFDKWWTKWKGVTNENGECELQAYYGDYLLRFGEHSIKFSFKHDKELVIIDSAKAVAAHCDIIRLNTDEATIY